ncbi:hypothetical protein KEM52_006611 [Ascosphaera acerosa]|nr:hypothetical protein KEM52_006611 [Ascosphaera acerosa]
MLELMRFLLVDLGLFRGAYLRDKPPPSYHDNAPPVYSEKPRLDAAAPPPYVQSECIGEKATMPAPVPQHAPERLPPELIEQIFLQCFEPAFAQASMLSGSPWTSDRVNFLQTAVSFFEICPQTGSTDQSGACDASGNRTPLVSPWTIRQGIRSAIVESNIAALDVLLRHFDSDGCKVRSRSGSSSDTGISSRKAGRSSQPYLHATTPENTPGDFSAAFTHPSMPLNSICQDHFLTAARCDCDSYVMKTLIKYGSESFPGDHPEVRRYATGLKQRKDAFGDVLLEYYLT